MGDEKGFLDKIGDAMDEAKEKARRSAPRS